MVVCSCGEPAVWAPIVGDPSLPPVGMYMRIPSFTRRGGCHGFTVAGAPFAGAGAGAASLPGWRAQVQQFTGRGGGLCGREEQEIRGAQAAEQGMAPGALVLVEATFLAVGENLHR